MADKTRERRDARPNTVLDPVRPAVVRRRVVTTIVDNTPRGFTSADSLVPGQPAQLRGQDFDDEDEDDLLDLDGDDDLEEEDNGPPSSVNVARALASLRADELRRVEQIVSADDDDEDEEAKIETPAPAAAAEVVVAAVPPAPSVPTVYVGKTIPLAKLAEQMKMTDKELTATLVASGFYSLHAKTILNKDTARTIAQIFGFQLEDVAEPSEPAAVEAASDSSPSTKPKKSSKTSKKPPSSDKPKTSSTGKKKSK